MILYISRNTEDKRVTSSLAICVFDIGDAIQVLYILSFKLLADSDTQYGPKYTYTLPTNFFVAN